MRSECEGIGERRFVAAGGSGTLSYGTETIYGARTQFLPTVGRTEFQVRVYFLGSLVWINSDRRDVIAWGRKVGNDAK